MKHLLFSLICIASLCISIPVQAVETATQDELLDYIKNPPPITSKDDWSKPTSPEMEAFLEKLAGTNQDQPESQMKQDETAAEFIKRRNLENLLLEFYGQDKLPDPTISTTQNPPNNGEPPRPSLNDSPKPVITDPSTWMKPTPSVPVIKTPTNVTVLDQIVPLKDIGINGQPLNNIINQLFYIGLIAAVILAIVMIIRGGLEYMTIDAITSKENGKNRVKAALGGLLLAFSAILILNTINPGLTKLNLKFDQLKLITSTTIFGGLTSGTRGQEGTSLSGVNTDGTIKTSYFGGPSDVRITSDGYALQYCDDTYGGNVGEFAESTNVGGTTYRWCYALDSSGNKIPFPNGSTSAHGGYFETASVSGEKFTDMTGDYIAYPLPGISIAGLPTATAGANSKLKDMTVQLTLENGQVITAKIADRGPHGSIPKIDTSPGLSQKIDSGGGLKSIILLDQNGNQVTQPLQ